MPHVCWLNLMYWVWPSKNFESLCKPRWSRGSFANRSGRRLVLAGGLDNPINSSTGFMRNIADKGIKWHVVVIMFYRHGGSTGNQRVTGFHQFRRSSMGWDSQHQIIVQSFVQGSFVLRISSRNDGNVRGETCCLVCHNAFCSVGVARPIW